MAGIGKISGPAGDQLAELERKQAEAQARKRTLETGLREAQARAKAADAAMLEVEAAELAGSATKADLARAEKELGAATKAAGPPPGPRGRRRGQGGGDRQTHRSRAFVLEHIDALTAALRDEGDELAARLRSDLEAASTDIERLREHEAQLVRLRQAASLDTASVSSVEHLTQLRRAIREPLRSGQVRAAGLQSDLTHTFIPRLSDDE